ncbi:MAG: decaprenyl-phosphate phosphoribosyltransferase [Bacteroidota bacterium]
MSVAAPERDLPALLRLLRPLHWVKNLFVLAPMVFARELFHLGTAETALGAFLGFCAVASAVYILNDMADAGADRAHPEKRRRPLAAGTVSRARALGLCALLLAAASGISLLMPPLYGAALGSYFLLNLLYSYRLKDIVLVDVFVIAAGFILRVLAGAFAIGVAVSSWIILCTLFLSLFFAFAKRRSELVSATGRMPERKTLAAYRVEFLDQMLTIAAAGTVVSYALYTVAPRTVNLLGTDNLIYTTPFVLFGIFRYLHLLHTTRSAENPTRAVVADPAILGVVVLWIAACVALLYVS